MIKINYKVNSISVASLIPAFVKASFFGFGMSIIFNSSKTSALLSLVIGIIISLIYMLIFLKVYSYKDNMTMFEKISYLFPKIISVPLKIIILLTIMFLNIMVYYLSLYFIVSHYLTQTPFLIVGIILTSVVFYLGIKDYEVLTRVSFLLVSLAFILLFLSVCGLLPHSEIENALPIYNYDIKGILNSVFVFFSLFCSPLFLITFIKKDNIIDKESFNKKAIIAFLISGLITLTVFFMVLSTIGINLIEIFSYPEYLALKKIKFSFIESVENLLFLLWCIFGYILCTTSTMYIKDSLCDMFKIKAKKAKSILVFLITAVLVLIPEFVFKGNSVLTNNIYKHSPFILSIVLCGTIIIVFIASLFKKDTSKTFKTSE